MTESARQIIGVKRWLGYALFALGVTILFTLGTWQLLRGLDKAAIQAQQSAMSDTRILRAAPEDWSALDYQRATLQGTWLTEKVFLLDNRLNNGRVGYEVLVPFALADDQRVVLVNRGWVAKPDQSRSDSYQTVADPENSLEVQGEIYRPQTGFTLGETWSGPIRWPLTVLYQDLPRLSEALGRPLEPATLVLSADSPHTLERIWQPINIPPERHYGYALQWWGLTLTLIIFGVIWRRRQRSS